MPPQIGNAISGLETGAGNLYNTISSAAGNLYNALPNPFAAGAPGTTAPGTTTAVPGITLPVDPTTTSLPTTTSALSLTPYTPPAPSADQVAAAQFPNAPQPAAVPGAPAVSPASQWGGPLKAIGNAIELIQRYQLQQNLQNPSWVAGQIGKLETPLSGALKNAVGKQVQAQAQEAGLGGAPGLFKSALAQALAPYQFAEQQDAEQAFFNSIGASEGAYPLGGGLGDFGTYAEGAFPQATA